MAGPTRISELNDGSPVRPTDQVPVARGSGATGYTYKVNAGRIVSDLFNVGNTSTVDLTFDTSTRTLSADVKDNSISNTELRDSAGLSVIGRSANSTGNPADIAGTVDQVLRVTSTGTSLGFGALNLAGAAAVTGALPVDHGGTGQTSFTNGQLLIGNTTGNTLTKATLTPGAGIGITNGAGAITVSHDGHTGDATGNEALTLTNTAIAGKTESASIATNDYLLLSDTSTSSLRKISIDSLMKIINNVPYLEYAWVTAPNTPAQSINANTLTVLTLTTEIADTGNFGSIDSNQITLAAGTYQYDAEAFYSAYSGTQNEGMLGLWNNDTSQFISRVGHSYLGSGGTYNLKGQFTISAQTVLTLRLFSNISQYIKPGVYYNTVQSSSTNSSYSQRTTIKLWKVG